MKVTIELKENYDLNDLKKLLENKGQTEISLIIHNKNKKDLLQSSESKI